MFGAASVCHDGCACCDPGSPFQPGSGHCALGGPALVLSARAVPWVLPASGGTVTVIGRVKNASSCQLELLTSYAVPVVYPRSSTPCGGGNFSAQVTFGANLASVGRTVKLALVARGATSMSSGRFYVHLESGYQAVAPTPVLPAGPPSVSVNDIKNLIWSGYVAVGGPYSAARGTFTVPALRPGNPRGADVTEWVGVDGLTSSGTFVYPPPEDTRSYRRESMRRRTQAAPMATTCSPGGRSSPGPPPT